MSTVRDFYNRRAAAGEARSQSVILALRTHCNYVKTLLLQDYAQGCARVLDLCGGRGGDLGKWRALGTVKHLVHVDVAQGAVDEAERRWQAAGGPAHFNASFYTVDCHTPAIDQAIGSPMFDVASCQFALHYAFETELKAYTMLSAVARHLKRGARFVGTVPDGHAIIAALQGQPALVNACCSISLVASSSSSTAIAAATTLLPAFGSKYIFTLVDAVDRVPEYLVTRQALEYVGQRAGLRLVVYESFVAFAARHEAPALYARMCPNPMSQEEDMAFALYNVFVFEKS
jgi:mRNA (guanine-N7-)-methyltransferase